MLLEDLLVIDAPTLYVRPTLGGELYALEPVDGATIKRVLDNFGRTPMPPEPAYQQILKGVPAIDYNREELIYRPRNLRTHKVYGYSPVEQINASGALETVAANMPRFDCEPDDVPILGTERWAYGSPLVAGNVAAWGAIAGSYGGAPLVLGKSYYWTMTISGLSSFNSQSLQIGTSVVKTITANGTFMGVVSSLDALTMVLKEGGVANASAGATFTISVKEITGYTVRKGDPKGLLIEEQRTNLLTYSADLSNGMWGRSGASIASGGATNPDGTTATKLIEDTTTAVHRTWNTSGSVVSGTTYTFTVFAKDAGRSKIDLELRATATVGTASFDLRTGTISAQSALAASITNFGNGWYRLSLTATATATGASNCMLYLNSGSTNNYTGDGLSGAYIWGMQLEAGAFPTSYIPTTSAQVTRAADVATINTLSPWFKATEWTIYSEFDSFAGDSTSIGVVVADTGGRFIYRNSGSPKTFDGTTQVIHPILSLAAMNKYAVSFSGTQRAISANGSSPTTGASAQVSPGRIDLGSASGYLNGHLRKLRYYPKLSSNAALQALTA